MANQIYLWHHLEMGDNLLCNAIVREYSNHFSKVHLFCIKRNAPAIQFMYRDLNNITYGIAEKEGQISNFFRNLEPRPNTFKKHITCGDRRLDARNFDELFYQSAGIPFEKRWSGFYVQRDLNREEELFNRLGLQDKQYVFVHDDSRRGFHILENYIVDKLVLRPDPRWTNNIFDYISILERASEIHCIDSAFAILVDQMNIQNNLFFHNYARKDSLWDHPKYKGVWRVYD